MEKNLGHATAYGYAKSKGYSGTEDEFAQLMADYASVGQSAAQSAEQAAASATSASGSAATAASAAQTATSKASEAVTAAGTATTKASEASQSASTASAAATSASTSAQTATTAASTATTKASEASESATTASAAKTDAETARDAAAQSASEAAESARTLTTDDTLTQAGQAADAKVVGDKIEGVKSDLSDVFTKSVYEKDDSSPAKIFECTIVANTTYYIKNIGSVSVNVRTCTSDGTEVEIVKNGITVGETVTFTATQNASYIRLYAFGGNSAVSVATNGEILKIEDANITKANTRIDRIEKANGLEWIVGSFINSVSGETGSALDRVCTGFIPCAENVSVSYVGENNHASVYGISFFDKYFKVISGDSNSGTLGDVTTVTSPAGTAYVRLSTKTSILEDSYFKVNDIKKTTLAHIANLVNDVLIYVDGVNGNDSTGNGSLTARYKTIGKAISVGATKIGIFPNSTYTETISLNGKDIHLFSYIDSASEYDGTTNPTRPKAIISGGGTVSTALTIQNARNVVLEDIIVTGCTYDGCKINKCQNVTIIGCEFNSNGNNGIVFNNSNGVFRDCIAHDNDHDGFNLNYFGDSQFFNCSGYDNGDDGISHHQGTTGLIDGGEWYGNAKGGVSSPCYGAKVDIRNVYSHDNKFGIYAFASDSSESRPFHIWNSVITDNSEYGVAVKYNVPYLYGNKISGNTTGQTTGYGTTTFHTLD